MCTALFPVPPPLADLIGSLLLTTLPGGPYLLPATHQALILFILNGEIRLHLPNGEVRRLPGFGLSGATSGTRCAAATPGTRILLAAVLPGQLPRLLGLPASAVSEAFVPLDELLPRQGVAELGEKLAASAIPTGQVAHCVSYLLALAAAQIQRGADLVVPADWLFRPLTEISKAFSLSPRQFERRFSHSYGQSLRAYRQQARCSRMLLDQVFGRRKLASWADIATRAGYFDQAHLSRDLRRYTGYAPAMLGRQLAGDDPALWPYRLSSQQISLAFGIPVL